MAPQRRKTKEVSKDGSKCQGKAPEQRSSRKPTKAVAVGPSRGFPYALGACVVVCLGGVHCLRRRSGSAFDGDGDTYARPWRPRTIHEPLARIGGSVIDDFVAESVVASLRSELERAVGDECAAVGPICFDPASYVVDPDTGERFAASPLPEWLVRASMDDASTLASHAGAENCVVNVPEADALLKTASISYVTSRGAASGDASRGPRSLTDVIDRDPERDFLRRESGHDSAAPSVRMSSRRVEVDSGAGQRTLLLFPLNFQARRIGRRARRRVGDRGRVRPPGEPRALPAAPLLPPGRGGLRGPHGLSLRLGGRRTRERRLFDARRRGRRRAGRVEERRGEERRPPGGLDREATLTESLPRPTIARSETTRRADRPFVSGTSEPSRFFST